MLKKLFNKIKEMNTIRGELQHYILHFTTVDGEEHTNNYLRYGAPDMLTCSVQEHFMTCFQCKGYLTDNDDTMYPIENVVSIVWECDDIIYNAPLKEYVVFYDKPLETA